MFNNKGQSLVIFILIIPILLGIMVLVIDVGNALNEKNNIDNTIEYVLDYGLKENIQNKEESLEVLLNYNLKNNQNQILIQDNIITISSKTYIKGIFSNILNIKGFEIESKYQGYQKDNKMIIEKIK